jgi:hypothetical protein
MHRKLALIIGGLLSFAALAAPSVEMQTSMGRIVIELDSEKGTKDRPEFRTVRQRGLLQWHGLSPGHSRFHDPGRRLYR